MKLAASAEGARGRRGGGTVLLNSTSKVQTKPREFQQNGGKFKSGRNVWSLMLSLECTLDRDVGLHMMSRSTALIKLSNHFHDTSLQPRFESDRRATTRVCPL